MAPPSRQRQFLKPAWKPGEGGGYHPRHMKTLISEALRRKLAMYGQSGKKTFAEMVSDRLLECVLHPKKDDKNVIYAIEVIVDRVEGRPVQQVDVNNVTDTLQARTDEELQYFLKYGAWPGLTLEAETQQAVLPPSDEEPPKSVQ